MHRRLFSLALALPLILAALLLAAACSDGEHDGQSREGAGEHGGRQHQQEGGEQSGQEGGEESANQLGTDEAYDHTRGGARLILTYSGEDNVFTGTVRNTTNEALTRVRVEVHLSNGIELGPTEPGDLAAGESREITLPASEEPFETWSAHPEVGEEQAGHQSDRERSEGGDGG